MAAFGNEKHIEGYARNAVSRLMIVQPNLFVPSLSVNRPLSRGIYLVNTCASSSANRDLLANQPIDKTRQILASSTKSLRI